MPAPGCFCGAMHVSHPTTLMTRLMIMITHMRSARPGRVCTTLPGAHATSATAHRGGCTDTRPAIEQCAAAHTPVALARTQLPDTLVPSAHITTEAFRYGRVALPVTRRRREPRSKAVKRLSPQVGGGGSCGRRSGGVAAPAAAHVGERQLSCHVRAGAGRGRGTPWPPAYVGL